MMDAAASASALALVGKSAPSAQKGDALDLPFRPGDRWAGTYTCRQGQSEMAILFEDVDRGPTNDEPITVEATFEFHFAGSASYAAADGVARMSGTYDPKSKRLRLVGEEWLEQPPSYSLVNLTGTLSVRGSGSHALYYTGTVEGPGCTSFTARPNDGNGVADEKAGPRQLPPRGLPRPRP